MSKHERRDKMKDLINRHNNLLEIIEKLKLIFEPSCLFSFVLSSVIMCIVSFVFLTIMDDLLSCMFYVVYIVLAGSQIWLLCYFGQKLLNSSVGVANQIYECEWTELDDNDFKKQIIVIIARAQRPEILTAMGFADISLETFTTVNFCYFSKFIKREIILFYLFTDFIHNLLVFFIDEDKLF